VATDVSLGVAAVGVDCGVTGFGAAGFLAATVGAATLAAGVDCGAIGLGAAGFFAATFGVAATGGTVDGGGVGFAAAFALEVGPALAVDARPAGLDLEARAFGLRFAVADFGAPAFGALTTSGEGDDAEAGAGGGTVVSSSRRSRPVPSAMNLRTTPTGGSISFFGRESIEATLPTPPPIHAASGQGHVAAGQGGRLGHRDPLDRRAVEQPQFAGHACAIARVRRRSRNGPGSRRAARRNPMLDSELARANRDADGMALGSGSATSASGPQGHAAVSDGGRASVLAWTACCASR